MKKISIDKRLKGFSQFTGITIPKIAYATGISREKLKKLEKDEMPADSKEVELLEEFFYKVIASVKKGPTVNEKKSFVRIFLHGTERTEACSSLEEKIGAIAVVNGKPAIVAYPNDSILYGDADGLIYMHDRGMEPDIKYGSIIAIRKIDVSYCHPGYCYYVVTNSHDRLLRRVYKEKNETIRLVSTSPGKYPDIRLGLDKIAAAFVVEAVVSKCI